MNHETRNRSIHGAGARFEAVLAPTCGLAEGILFGLFALLRKRERRRAARQRERAIAVTARQLSRLDDRVLRDIGIARDAIPIAAEAVVDDPNVNLRKLAGH